MQARFGDWLAMASLSFLVSGCAILGAKAADEPASVIIAEDGAVQIREYEAFSVVETTLPGRFDVAARAGFRRLFDYIGGANHGSEEIEMTAPVLVRPQETGTGAMALAAPQPASAGQGGFDDGSEAWTIAFVLPEGMTAASAPRPADARVSRGDVPAHRVAVIRFPGWLRAVRAERWRRELAAWLGTRGIAHEGDWRIAGYNPPWTLPWLRRNEVIVTLSQGG